MEIKEIELKIPSKNIKLGENTIEIKQYIPTLQKIQIFEAIQETCLNEEIINQPKLDALFNAYILLNYTDIEFESREADDLIKLYDYFELNGYMTSVINAIPKVEYNALLGYLQETINDYNRFKVSILGAVESLMVLAPVLMERVKEISKDIDIDALNIVNKIYSEFK